MVICPSCSEAELMLVGGRYVCPNPDCGQNFSLEAIDKLPPYTPGTVFPRSCPALVAGDLDVNNGVLINPHGILSCTEVAFGVYEIKLQNAAPNDNFAVIGMAQDRANYACRAFEHQDDLPYKSTTSFRIRTEGMAKAAADVAGWIPYRCNFYFKLGW